MAVVPVGYLKRVAWLEVGHKMFVDLSGLDCFGEKDNKELWFLGKTSESCKSEAS